MLNNGRLKGLLQRTGQNITRSTTHIQNQIAFEMFWNLKNRFGLGRNAETKY